MEIGHKNITLEQIYHKLILLERALQEKGIIIKKEAVIYEDEEELTEEARSRLEKARKIPISQYNSHEDAKKRILARR